MQFAALFTEARYVEIGIIAIDTAAVLNARLEEYSPDGKRDVEHQEPQPTSADSSSTGYDNNCHYSYYK